MENKCNKLSLAISYIILKHTTSSLEAGSVYTQGNFSVRF